MSRVKLQTSLGDIVLELDTAKAPGSGDNFMQYVNDGFYDNTVFHRVINGFMVQGGGFDPGMMQKTTRAPIRNEAENGLGNEAYTVAMARTPSPHSATSQFFIYVAGDDFLNFRAATTDGYGHCVSGAWSRAVMWSTRSRVWPPAAAECTRTSRKKTSSSRKPKR
jgi:peptidyl-prolyl cis-trans isomerase B (cyclophilin B)